MLQRDKHTLVVTVGLPRSGKSTWARKQSHPIVNPDSIRLALHGTPFYAPAEPMVWAVAKLMVRALFLAGAPVVILDATNCTRARRAEWRSKEWSTHFKVFETDAVTCMERARLEGNEEIKPVIVAMDREAEPLGPDESRWP